MKKIVACLLVALMLVTCSNAFAAGKLSVTQENFHFIAGYWNYGYVYAKVENVGDKPIKVNAGVLEIYDADGEVITSTDYLNAYATYLQPGEYTYVELYEDLEEGDSIPDDYMLTLTGKSDNSRIALRLPVETKLEMNVVDGWWTYNYMYAVVTNNTDDVVYNLEVVLALLDAEGNILYIDGHDLYSSVGVNPGAAVTFRLDISSSFIEYFDANGIVPVSVDAIAYAIVDNE